MPPEEQDLERWARQLAGGKTAADAADASPETQSLRSAILTEDQAVTAAAAADRLARARLMKHLEAKGLFEVPESRSKRGLHWPVWLSAAAAVLIVAVGVRFVSRQDVEDPGVTYRGLAGSVTIVSAERDVTAAQVMEQLRAIGLEPGRVSDGGRVIIEVDVTAQRLDAFYEWAARRNGRAVTPGVYRVFIDPPNVTR